MTDMAFIGRPDDVAIDSIDYERSRRSLERPNGIDEEVDILLGPRGANTSAGIVITEETAMMASAVWRAVNLVAKDVARLPLEVFRRLDNERGKERAFLHPAYRLLREQANPSTSALHFRMEMMATVLLRGNAYAFIQRDARGAPAALEVLEERLVKPFRVDGQTWYELRTQDGGQQIIPGQEVIHIKGLPSPRSNGLEGMSVLEKARESLGLGLAARQHQAYFFSNAARPSVLLEYPGALDENERSNLIRSWREFYSGIRNAHRTAVLENGMKASPLTINAADSQLLETRKFEIREIANWFSIPAFKLQDDARSSFNSLEIEQQAYLDEGLDSWLVVWEDECRQKLLTTTQKQSRSHVIEFNRNALVRADLSTRTEAYAKAIQGGWMTPNEARSRENMNALPGGDDLLIPLNFAPADQLPEAGQPEDEPQQDVDTARLADLQLRADRVRHVVKKLMTKAQKAARNPRRFITWLDVDLEKDNAADVQQKLQPVCNALGIDTGQAVRSVFSDCRHTLLTAAEVQPAGLQASVRHAAEAMERDYPMRFMADNSQKG